LRSSYFPRAPSFEYVNDIAEELSESSSCGAKPRRKGAGGAGAGRRGRDSAREREDRPEVAELDFGPGARDLRILKAVIQERGRGRAFQNLPDNQFGGEKIGKNARRPRSLLRKNTVDNLDVT
jgi:hypothetical protein